MIPFWCLMPKGEKLRLKQMDQLPLENFENSRVRVFVLSKDSYGLLLSKIGLLWVECLIMGKRGSFWIFDQFLLEYLSLWLNKWIWHRDRKLSLICKNKPSGGKEWSKYAKFESKQILVLICIDVALLYVAFLLCWHKSPKRGRLKGKCALGPFLSILVIRWPTKMVMC
jgi:hypothetical protein